MIRGHFVVLSLMININVVPSSTVMSHIPLNNQFKMLIVHINDLILIKECVV